MPHYHEDRSSVPRTIIKGPAEWYMVVTPKAAVSLASLVSPKQWREPVSKKGRRMALQERHWRVSASAHLARVQAFKRKIELLWKLSSLHLRKFSSAPFSLLSLTLFLPQFQIKPAQESGPSFPGELAVSGGGGWGRAHTCILTSVFPSSLQHTPALHPCQSHSITYFVQTLQLCSPG